MLAETKHVDIAHDDHLVMVFGKNCVIYYICGREGWRKSSSISTRARFNSKPPPSPERPGGGERTRTGQPFFITTSHPQESLGVSLGSSKEAISIGIFTDAFQEDANGTGEFCFAFFAFGRCRVEPADGGFG